MVLKSLYPSSRTLLLTLVRSSIYSIPAPLFANHSGAHRGLSTTTALLKKGGGKQEQKRTVEINSAKTEGRDDAGDFSGYHHEIDKATDFLKNELSKLRAGGLDLEAIEALNVNLGSSGGAGGGGPKKDGSRSGGKGKGDTVKLGDVAQVVPRGTIVVIMVGEKEHLKPVASALYSSPMNLQPQTPSPTISTPINLTSTFQLELHIPVPPTTTASRQAASGVASKKEEAALLALNQARAAEKKRLRALYLARKIGPDDLRRSKKEMEKINKDSQAAMEKLVRERKRTLEGA